MKLTKYVLIISGFLVFLYTILMLFLLGYSAGALALFLASIVLVLCGLYLPWLLKHRFLAIFFLSVVILVLAFTVFLFIFGSVQSPDDTVDVVIVLGAQIEGETVQEHLESRLKKVLIYLEAHPDTLVVVSGGQGDGERIPEAEAMKRYLVAHGIDETRIISESRSLSTYENLENTKLLLQERFENGYHALIVSSEYHIFRASLMATKLGYSASFYASHTRWYEYPYRVAREYIALCKLLLLGR